jgi:hypothetical protein
MNNKSCEIDSSLAEVKNNLSNRDQRSTINPQDIKFEDNTNNNRNGGAGSAGNKSPPTSIPVVNLTNENFPPIQTGRKNQQR